MRALNQFADRERASLAFIKFSDRNFLAAKPNLGRRGGRWLIELAMNPGMAALNKFPRFSPRTATRNRRNQASRAFHAQNVTTRFWISAKDDWELRTVNLKER